MGSKTADEAGALKHTGDFRLAGWKPTLSFMHRSAAADTTDLEFPEDEEESRKHLVRDISIFLIASAFLAFFLIKVFLEGEEEEPPPEDDGKQIPGSAASNPAGQRSW
ncbi:MAG: hypothetical protein JSW50_07375 [Candidatus Latescibacterota bacterium]|nr:MAG: hypothetical protein JSW50_07375 [Candidatus Latescibacterota bacterium]